MNQNCSLKSEHEKARIVLPVWKLTPELEEIMFVYELASGEDLKFALKIKSTGQIQVFFWYNICLWDH
jgi:hypothetical protein